MFYASKKTAPCPACGETRAANAHVCPHCGNKRMRFADKFIWILLAVFTVAILKEITVG